MFFLVASLAVSQPEASVERTIHSAEEQGLLLIEVEAVTNYISDFYSVPINHISTLIHSLNRQ